jgi:hypothetical protein
MYFPSHKKYYFPKALLYTAESVWRRVFGFPHHEFLHRICFTGTTRLGIRMWRLRAWCPQVFHNVWSQTQALLWRREGVFCYMRWPPSTTVPWRYSPHTPRLKWMLSQVNVADFHWRTSIGVNLAFRDSVLEQYSHIHRPLTRRTGSTQQMDLTTACVIIFRKKKRNCNRNDYKSEYGSYATLLKRLTLFQLRTCEWLLNAVFLTYNVMEYCRCNNPTYVSFRGGDN